MLITRFNQLFVIAIFFLLAFWLQSSIGIHGDVAYLIKIAHSITAGQKYGIDFYETNPPMILYLYLPVQLLAKMSSMSIVTILRIYVFVIAFFSLLLSSYFLKKIITNPIVFSIFIGSMLFVTLILPVNQFGQREHLLIVLTLPYLFAAVLRLDNHDLPFIYAVCIGLLAGLGFGIKPYFLYTLVLIELYFMIKMKSMWGWVRIESMIILMVLITYLVSTILFYPTYFSKIMPLVNQFYFIGIREPWINMLFNPLLVFSLIVLFAYLIISTNKEPHFTLKKVLMLALLGFMLSLFTTRTTWFYHCMPTVSLACLLLVIYYGEFTRFCFTSVRHHFYLKNLFIILVGILLFAIPLYPTYVRIAYTIQDTKKGDLTQLTHYLAAQPGKHSVSCFSANTPGDCFPLTLDTNSIYGSRYPFFWWMRGLVIMLKNHQTSTEEKNNYKNYFSESIAHDLNHFDVRWVIINTRSAHYAFGNAFNYITFFSTNKKFREMWSHYSFKKRIGVYEIYERHNHTSKTA